MIISQSFTVEVLPGRKLFRTILIVGIICCFAERATAQGKRISAGTISTEVETTAPLASLQIAEVIITGNAKTRPFIVLREVPFRKGDSLSFQNLQQLMKLAKEQLMNTTLFVDVDVFISSRIQTSQQQQAVITIAVKERWYLFPVPYFKLVDRNFNQWWVEQNRSLDRVNYGLKFIQNNFTGRNDNLDIWLITGYNKQISFRYQLPFIDKKLKSGLNMGFAYATQKELNYSTQDNKQQFFKQDTVMRETVRFDVTYSYRPDVKQRHYFRLSYNKEHVADTIVKLNPQYFPVSGSLVNWFDFNYQFKYFNVDYIAYPTRGWMLDANIYTRMLQKKFDLWQASARMVYAIPLKPGVRFLHLEGIAVARTPVNNAFVNQRLIGYGYTQMRGLEYNVVDGSAAGIVKTTFHQRALSVVLQNPVSSKTHDRIPIRVFVKAYADLGYGYNRYGQSSNTLNNSLLRSWGIGIDIVSIYDFVFKIEYSMNQLGREGVYLHSRNDF